MYKQYHQYKPVMNKMECSPRICVLGAGIIGLSSAAAIVALPGSGYNVTVVADKFTTETTSDGAFGFWEPYLVGETPEADIRRWGKATLERMLSLAHSAEAADAGCFTFTGSSVFTQHTEEPVWKDVTPDYRNMTKEEIFALGPQYRSGRVFTSAATECRFYLPWLMKKLKSAGVNIVRKAISDISEIEGQYDVIVNCTGLGSIKLFKDTSLTPIQGQVIRVHAPWVKCFLNSDDEDLYILPGIDSVVLGGTRVEGSWDVAVSQVEKTRILEGCIRLMPSLARCRVLRDWVGIRPGRSRVRLEKEVITSPRGIIKVVHNYGHGGSGITLHWGCALDTAKLVQQLLAQSHL